MNAALFVLNWNKKKEKKEKGAATFTDFSSQQRQAQRG